MILLGYTWGYYYVLWYESGECTANWCRVLETWSGGIRVALLKAESLSLSSGRVPALQGVSLEVESGDLFAVIGPDGSGKTSLLNCIN